MSWLIILENVKIFAISRIISKVKIILQRIFRSILAPSEEQLLEMIGVFVEVLLFSKYSNLKNLRKYPFMNDHRIVLINDQTPFIFLKKNNRTVKKTVKTRNSLRMFNKSTWC